MIKRENSTIALKIPHLFISITYSMSELSSFYQSIFPYAILTKFKYIGKSKSYKIAGCYETIYLFFFLLKNHLTAIWANGLQTLYMIQSTYHAVKQ